MMEAVEQGKLLLSGIPCEGAPFQLRIQQSFNSHGVLEGAIWVPEDSGQAMVNVPVILEAGKQGMPPLFCGVVTSSVIKREKGRRCAYIQVHTSSIQMDGIRRNRSFQNQNRSYEQLAGLVAAPYQALCAWEGEEAAQPVGRFFLQYEETDWEFLKRVAAEKGCSVLAETRMSQTGVYIGLPKSREERRLEAEQYSVRNRMAGCMTEDKTISAGLEYVVRNRYEIMELGDRVRFQGQLLVVAAKEIVLQNGLLQGSYTLRPEPGFQVDPIKNYRMIGAAVPGTVLESSPDRSRLHLSTDVGEETAQSWHQRSVFYTGSGKGYGGRPESGDTMYLYFGTENEADRCVIGGAGAGYEQLQSVTQQIMDDTEEETEKAKEKEVQTALENGAGDLGLIIPQGEGMSGVSGVSGGSGVSGVQGTSGGAGTGSAAPKKADAANTHKYKNWSTPNGRVLSLNEGGIRLQNGGGKALNLNGSGVLLKSTGTVQMKGKNGNKDPMIFGKQVSLQAKEYVYIKCGMSEVALLPKEIHVKGTKVYFESPLNVYNEPVDSDMVVEGKKKAYYKNKWGNPIQLFMPDGTPIGIHEKEMMKNEALRNYFNKNVLETEGYVNYLASPELDKYYKDGTIEIDSRQLNEDKLYRKWLSVTYGKTNYEKFVDMLSTREGMHAALDVAGFGLEIADATNGILYITEGDYKNAALSFIGCIPLLGDYIVKGGKYAVKGIDVIKLARPGSKAIKSLDNITVYIKAGNADMQKLKNYFLEWTDNLSTRLLGDPYMEFATPDGLSYRMPVSRNLDMSLEMANGKRMTRGIEGGSGANNARKETELFMPDEAYNKQLPKFTTPGTKSLPKYDEWGNLKQIKYYDDYGREIGWIDYSNHGYPDNHTVPHWHEVQWNAQYPIGGYQIDHRMDINPPFGN